MTEETLGSHLRTGSDETTSCSGDEATDGSSSAEEIERIVAVAEVLKIDPQFARIALEEGDGGLSTDCKLTQSVAMVEKRLTPRN